MVDAGAEDPALSGDSGVDDAERRFQELYGPWEPAPVEDLRAWLGSWDRPWWLAGGYAIDAFTGTTRPHADVDVGIFRRDVPALHDHLGDRFHLWSAGSGSLRPLRYPEAGIDPPEFPTWAGQLWVRRRSTEPWLIDVLTTRDRDGAWTCRLDPDLAVPLGEAVWVPETGRFAGLRVLRPEYVLAHKARHDNAKDRDDLERALPLLDDGSRTALLDLVATAHPGHAWLAAIADAVPSTPSPDPPDRTRPDEHRSGP